MTTIWTPDGERRVTPSAPGDAQAAESSAPGSEEVTPEQLEEMEHLERELLQLPVADVVANHCYGLFQLAALHLAQRPARLDEARLAIDALGAIVDGLGDRLGESTDTLAEGLSSLRLAFVEIAKAASPPPDTAAEEP